MCEVGLTAGEKGSGSQPRIEDAECIYKGDINLLDICQCRSLTWVLKCAGTVKI